MDTPSDLNDSWTPHILCEHCNNQISSYCINGPSDSSPFDIIT